MPNAREVLKSAIQIKEIFLFIGSIIMVGLATYITLRLVPVYQRIDSLEYRVHATEEIDKQYHVDIKELRLDVLKIKEDTSYIRGYLER